MPEADRKQTVLLLHNRYREPGGEERSVTEIGGLLEDRGHRVQLYQRSSRSLDTRRGRVRAAIAMLAGGEAPSAVGVAVERSEAEILHAHNINPLFGPNTLEAARKAGARVVMHLHNYRLVCAIAIAYREGGVCTRCQGRNTLPGIGLRCRGSLGEAAAYGAGLSLHQEKVLANVDRFVVPSEAARARLADLGLPLDSVDVLPNFLADTEFAETSRAGGGEYALFAGRLAEEKGVDTVIEAAKQAGVPLVIAGSGPDQHRLEELARDAPVRFAGRLSRSALADARRRAAFAVAPSRWDEPGPYSVIEAMAAGLPVLASTTGGLPEMVGSEAALPPAAPERWAAAMDEQWSDPQTRQERGERAVARARELFGAERFYIGLMRIYDRAATRP